MWVWVCEVRVVAWVQTLVWLQPHYFCDAYGAIKTQSLVAVEGEYSSSESQGSWLLIKWLLVWSPECFHWWAADWKSSPMLSVQSLWPHLLLPLNFKSHLEKSRWSVFDLNVAFVVWWLAKAQSLGLMIMVVIGVYFYTISDQTHKIRLLYSQIQPWMSAGVNLRFLWLNEITRLHLSDNTPRHWLLLLSMQMQASLFQPKMTLLPVVVLNLVLQKRMHSVASSLSSDIIIFGFHGEEIPINSLHSKSQ